MKNNAMSQRRYVFVGPFRPRSWGGFAQSLLLALLTNAFCAANLPTFTYPLSDVQIGGIATDSVGNTYIAEITTNATIAASSPTLPIAIGTR